MNKAILKYAFVCSLSLLMIFGILENTESSILTLTKFGLTKHNNHFKNIYGAYPNPMKEPIGGGTKYSRFTKRYSKLVNNKAEFLFALDNAKSGDIIYIADSSKIDLSGCNKLKIAKDVTIASGRGHNNSLGALLFSNQLHTEPMIFTSGENIRITGLRFSGPDTTRRTEQMIELFKSGGHRNYYSIPNSVGISSDYSKIEIDNCEFWGWSYCAVYISGKGEPSENIYIHNNNFHHNQRQGLGYGICIDNAHVLIEGNMFNWCRHGIAGTGRSGSSYEARYNLIFEKFSSHAFDMHGGVDRNDGTDIAGSSILIHHNTFKLLDQNAIVIRGIPSKEGEIYNNLFYNSDSTKSVVQYNPKGHLKIYNNKYSLQN